MDNFNLIPGIPLAVVLGESEIAKGVVKVTQHFNLKALLMTVVIAD